jgi:tetratricopeptide (TPR) repeat protein
LSQADHFADLYNWSRAAPLYAEAEREFRIEGNERNALYAHFGNIRASLALSSPASNELYLGSQLQTAWVQGDARLMMKCLIAKGYVDYQLDPLQAETDWKEVRRLARELGDRKWRARADGELAGYSFLAGDTSQAWLLMKSALTNAFVTRDWAALIQYASNIGEGLVEMDQPETGFEYCNRALKGAALISDFGFLHQAYTCKGQALVALGRRPEAQALLGDGLREAQRRSSRIGEAEILVVLGKEALSRGARSEAVSYFERATTVASAGGFNHTLAWSGFELANLYRENGQHQSALQSEVLALGAMRHLSDKYHFPLHLTLLADLKLKTGKPREAEALYDEAADDIEAMLVNAPNAVAKSSLIATMSETYVGLFRLAAQAGNTKRGFRVIETARGRTIADSWAPRGTLTTGSQRSLSWSRRSIVSRSLC